MPTFPSPAIVSAAMGVSEETLAADLPTRASACLMLAELGYSRAEIAQAIPMGSNSVEWAIRSAVVRLCRHVVIRATRYASTGPLDPDVEDATLEIARFEHARELLREGGFWIPLGPRSAIPDECKRSLSESFSLLRT